MTEPVHLTRVDPALNMARFYAICTQPTLFGEVAVLRRWGRIGTAGRVRLETFGDAAAAGVAQDRLAGQKRRRGYQVRDVGERGVAL